MYRIRIPKKSKLFLLGKSSKQHLKNVRPEIIMLVERALSKSNYDFGIPKYGGKRTAKIQYLLFCKRPKVTQLDGYKKLSYHQSGNAFDIFVLIRGKASWKCYKEYKIVADTIKQEFELMKSEGIFNEKEHLRWGGDWTKFKDRPHFEIRYYA